MRTLALLGQRRFIQAIHRTVSITSSFYNQPTTSFNFYCTQPANDVPEESYPEKQEQPKCLSLRIERLPRGEPVGSAFQSWMGEGFPIHRGDIFHAINRLRKLKLNKRALEVICLIQLCLLM